MNANGFNKGPLTLLPTQYLGETIPRYSRVGAIHFFITESPREKEKELRVDSMRIRHIRLWCFLKNTAKFNFEVIIVSRRASERDQYFAWSYYLQVMTDCPLQTIRTFNIQHDNRSSRLLTVFLSNSSFSSSTSHSIPLA